MFRGAKLAVVVAVAALGALAAVALASDGRGGADPAAVQTRDDQPEVVRTQVVRRTVHVVAQPAATPDDHGRRGRGADDGPRHDVADDRGADDRGADDGPAHDAGDDHGGHRGHGGGDDDSSGRGGGHGGHGGGDD